MTELTPQEKLLKLQEMGKMPADDWFQNYVKLAQENAALLTMIKAANKIVEDEENWNWHEPEVRQKLRDTLQFPSSKGQEPTK